MQKLSYKETVLSQIGSLFGMDKKSFNERIEWAKDKDEKALIQIAIQETDPSDRALMYRGVEMLRQYKNKYIKLHCLIDMASSGASLLSATTRCIMGMASVGAIDITIKVSEQPGNLYQLIADTLNEKLGTNFTRKQVKACSVPYYYGGIRNVKDLMEDNEDMVASYEETYAYLLPGAADFRANTAEAWNPEWVRFGSTLFDGFEWEQCNTVWSKPQGITIGGRRTNIPFRIPGCKTKGEEGTLGLGAYLVHSLDAAFLRELKRMAHMPKERAYKILNHIGTMDAEDNVREWHSYEEFDTLKRTVEKSLEFGIVSNRIFYLVEKTKMDIKVPTEILLGLREWVEYLPDAEYSMIHIHDEFGVLPSKFNQFRKAVNYVYACIYRSNIMEVWNKEFNMNVKVNPFERKVFDTLLEADYILS